jgi:septal ring-binding cell division protein DamX
MKLEGEIGEIELIERFVELGREHFTGAIRFENDGIIKIIYFKGGDVLGASTNDRTDSIDEILLRAGKVTRDHVKQALARRKENETLGDALLNLGFITRKELGWARRVQVLGIIRSIEGWTSGSFTIVSDYLPKREEGTLFPLQQLLLELIVTDPDRQKFERVLDGGNATFRKSADFDATFPLLGLNQDAEQIAATVDGRRSASEIAAAAGKDGFNTYKLLHALTVLGLLQRVAKPQVTLQDSSADDLPFGYVADAETSAAAAAPPFESDDDLWGPAQPVVAEPFETPASAASDFAFEDAPELDFSSDPLPDDPSFEPSPASTAYELPVSAEVAAPTAVTAAAMPAWDASSRMSTPAAQPSTTTAGNMFDEPEPKWGFDEAQIEAARRASVPVASAVTNDELVHEPLVDDEATAPKRGRGGLIAAIVAILLLAGGGYAGFLWWQKQNEPVPEAALTPHAAALRRKAALHPTAIVPLPAGSVTPATSTTAGALAAGTTNTTGTSVAGTTNTTGTSSSAMTASAGTSTAAPAVPMRTANETVGIAPTTTTSATRQAAVPANAPVAAHPAPKVPGGLRPQTSTAAASTTPVNTATMPRSAAVAPAAGTPTKSTPVPAPMVIAGKPAKPSRVSTSGKVTNDPTSSTRIVTNSAGKSVITNGATSGSAKSGSATSGKSALPKVAAVKPASAKPAPAKPAAMNPVAAPVSTASAGSASQSGSGRERYDAMARDFASNPSGAFTVQFELVCQTASLATATKAGGSQVWFVPTTFKGNGCYRVFWGHYATRAEASKAAAEIPSSLRGGSPAVVAVPKG